MKTFSDPIIQAIAKAIDDSIETMENIYKDKIACRILSSPPFECNNRKVTATPLICLLQSVLLYPNSQL